MAGFDSQTFPQSMSIDKAYKHMTRVIVAIFIAVNVLAYFPFSHHHHDPLPECSCAEDAGHYHSYHADSFDEPCIACQLLGHVGIICEFDLSIETIFTHVCFQSADSHTSVIPERASARAPPVSLLYSI